MKQLLFVGWLLLMQLVASVAGNNGTTQDVRHLLAAQTIGEAGDSNAACQQWVDSVMNTLSTEEKVGQLFVYTIEPSMVSRNIDLLQRVVGDYKVGGLLFSGGTIENQVQLTNLAQLTANVPLLITFDGEWGLAMRLKETPSFPRNMVLGCIEDNSLLYEYGKEVARQCKEIGVQVNFAPVADVNINPKNPVINTRSFGENPKRVTDKVVAYSLGLEHNGVLAVAKHFPGHGDTNVDSHKALPTLPFNRQRLDSIELYPFREMVQYGVSGVMVGHLFVPALEPKNNLPSSLSHNIVQGMLVDTLGFKGLIFTDALAMKGVSGHANVCLKALMAGNDMVLTPPTVKRELDGVIDAVKRGEMPMSLLNEKCRKVLTYKYMLGLNQRKEIDLTNINARINTPTTRDLMRRLETASITLLKNSDNLLPLPTQQENPVLLLEIGTPEAFNPLAEKIKEFNKVKRIRVHSGMNEAEVLRDIAFYPQVIVAVGEQKPAGFEPFLNKLMAKKDVPPVTMIYFTPARTMLQLPAATRKAQAVLLAHSRSSEVMKYSAAILFGRARVDGRLSASVGTLFAEGAGITIGPEAPVMSSPGTILGKMVQPALRQMKVDETDLPEAAPLVEEQSFLLEDMEIDPTQAQGLEGIDEIVLEGLNESAFPGCQVVVLKDGKKIYDKAFGTMAGDGSDSVTISTLYDVASLTKTSATLLAVMKLYDEGKLNLTDPISKHLPWLKGTDKAAITVQELLYHQSGLPASINFYIDLIDKESYEGNLFSNKRTPKHTVMLGRNSWGNAKHKFLPEYASKVRTDSHTTQVNDELWITPSFNEVMRQKIVDAKLGPKRYRYSDISFVLLHYIAEKISGESLDSYLAKNFYEPMGLHQTGFQPLNHFEKAAIAPSAYDQFFRKQVVQGFVHDETAALHGGVAGSAGLFSTAQEIACIYQMLLNEGEWNGKRYLSASTCQLFTGKRSSTSRRGLGFDRPDVKDPQKSPCAENAPGSTFGHTGFTGTCVWADPTHNIVYVLLSNRTYPSVLNRKFSQLNIRPRIQEVIYNTVK